MRKIVTVSWLGPAPATITRSAASSASERCLNRGLPRVCRATVAGTGGRVTALLGQYFQSGTVQTLAFVHSAVAGAQQRTLESPAKNRGSTRNAARSIGQDLPGKAIIDASRKGRRAAYEPARQQAALQTIKAVFRKDRIAPPHSLRLVAGERTGQYVPVGRREKR